MARKIHPNRTDASRQKQFHWGIVLSLIIVGVLLYGFTLPFPFEFDDQLYLLNNPYVRDFHSFGFPFRFAEFVNYPRTHGLDSDLSVNFVMRPIAYLTFNLNYAAHGLKPSGFRLVNIAIHCTNAILLYRLLWDLLRHSPKFAVARESSARFIAVTAAFAFLAHPLQTESVTYIVQRFTSLGTCFYLLTLRMALSAYVERDPLRAKWLKGESLAALLLGMLSKEIVFTAPLMLIAMDCWLLGTSLRSACKRAIPHLLCLPLVPFLILLTSSVRIDVAIGPGTLLNIVNYANYSPFQYAVTQVSVILKYLSLIVVPMGLNVDPDYPLSKSLGEPRVVASLLFITTVLAGTWLWQRRRPGDGHRSLLLCGTIWYFLTLSIDSSIVPLPDVMAEHRTYLLSIGALTALACGADVIRIHLHKRNGFDFRIPATVCIWILVLGATTIARNQVWRSRVSLWEDAASKSPLKPRTWFNLAGAYYQEGHFEKAERCNLRTIELDPKATKAYVNHTTLELLLRKYDNVVEYALIGLQLNPDRQELNYNLGAAYAAQGNYEEALEAISRALAKRPDHARSYLMLGKIYASLQRYELSWQNYSRAVSLDPAMLQSGDTVSEIKAVRSRL